MPEESKAQSSGATGDSGATAGKQDNAKIISATPENAEHRLDPSAPGRTGTTPGSNG